MLNDSSVDIKMIYAIRAIMVKQSYQKISEYGHIWYKSNK